MDENNVRTERTTFIIPKLQNEKGREMIINNLRAIQGVSNLYVDQDQNCLEITFDPTIASPTQFANLIRQLECTHSE